ncbi:alpha/beta fold hydrolase [Brevundimonas denitrificans]|uniref:alpha/beta fold hydrolase n=1 Tax=Brevundimonas denitrificans TaxID=1443434 RepID=UPI00223BAB15|nr:alpha/beta hydrolase [Brevundimonas denitrificans]
MLLTLTAARPPPWPTPCGRGSTPTCDVRLERVDGARHFIMADQPEAFMALVRAFLSE